MHPALGLSPGTDPAGLIFLLVCLLLLVPQERATQACRTQRQAGIDSVPRAQLNFANALFLLLGQVNLITFPSVEVRELGLGSMWCVLRAWREDAWAVGALGRRAPGASALWPAAPPNAPATTATWWWVRAPPAACWRAGSRRTRAARAAAGGRAQGHVRENGSGWKIHMPAAPRGQQ